MSLGTTSASRRTVTPVIALLSASAITATPVTAPQDVALHSSHHVVQLTANPTALDVYARGVVQGTYVNLLNDLGEITYPLASLAIYPQRALAAYRSAVAEDDRELALAIAGKALTEPVEAVLRAPLRFATEYALPVLASLTVYPVANAILATYYALRDLGEAIQNANVVDIVNAVLAFPGKIIHGVVNGFVDWDYDEGSSTFPPTGPTAFPSLLSIGASPQSGKFNYGFLPLLVDFFDESVPRWTTPTVSTEGEGTAEIADSSVDDAMSEVANLGNATSTFAEPAAEPVPVEPTTETTPAEPATESTPGEPTDEATPAEPTTGTTPAEPTEATPAEPTADNTSSQSADEDEPQNGARPTQDRPASTLKDSDERKGSAERIAGKREAAEDSRAERRSGQRSETSSSASSESSKS